MGRFQEPACTIFVRNIETRVTEEHLWELFLQAGPLRNVHIALDRNTGLKRGFAFVTYRDEVTVPYACELFNCIRLFKKPIYCNPSNTGKNSATPSPARSDRSSQESPPSNNSLIEGILNRSNSSPSPMSREPLSSTPFQEKRRFSVTAMQDEVKIEDSRVVDITGSRDRSYNSSKGSSRIVVIDDEREFVRPNDRDRSRFGDSGDRDRGRCNDSGDRSRGRYDNSSGGYQRSNSRDDRSDRGDRGERNPNDRASSSSRYDRSNSQNSSQNSSFGNMSPMHVQALNNSYNNQNTQLARQNSSPSNFGPMRPDSSSQRDARKQRSQPY